MSNELQKPARVLMGIMGLGSLFVAAATPYFINKTDQELDRLNRMSSNEIQTTYADWCKRHEFTKSFDLAIKDVKAKDPNTITLTADENSDSFKLCPQKMHVVAIKANEAMQSTNWVGGGLFLTMSGLGAYMALGSRRKETPKP